jgi:hypothetical protein
MKDNEEGTSMKTGRLTKVGLLLVAMTLLCQGCGIWKKYSANSAIKKVKQTLDRAQQEGANRYSSDLFTTAQSLIQQAEADVEAGNYEEALNKTNQAESKALDSIKMVPENKQIVQRKAKELTDLVQEIQATLEKAESSPSKAVAEAEIATARETFGTVQTEVQQLIGKTAQKAAEFDEIIQNVNETGDIVQQAYNLTQTETAEALAAQLEEKIAALDQLQFSLFLPQEAEAAGTSYGQFRSLFEQKDFEPAIALGEALSATFEQAVPAARQARAEQTVQKAEQLLAQAAELGGIQFAPEQMKAGQLSLGDARTQLAAAEYDQAYNIALQAVGSADVAMEEIKRSIESQIEVIQGRIVEAEETGADRFAPQELVQGRARLASAFNSLTDKDYQSARALQKEAAEAVEQAFQAAKKGQAREKLDRVAAIIDGARKQGADQYVPQSLKAAQEKLAEAMAIFNKGDYVEVHPVADLAENLSHKIIADLKELAGEKIEEARQQIVLAETARASEYAAQFLADAQSDAAQAAVQLAAEEFLKSLQLAQKSLENGKAAEDQSYSLRTDQKLTSARQERALAQDSGAKEHSAAAFLEAYRQEENAVRFQETRQFKQALEAATLADDGFRGARLSKIDKASGKVASAVEALAEQFDPQTMATAQGLLAEAKMAMENKAYPESNQKADQAAQIADQAERTTWDKRATAEIQKWDAAFALATRNFAPEKAAAPYADSKNAGVQAKAEYAVKNYKPAYYQAVKAMEAIDRVNQVLVEESAKTMEEIGRRITNLQTLAVDEPGRKMIGQLIETAAQARTAQEQQNYQAIFALEKNFIASAQTTELQLKAHNLNTQRVALQAEIADLKQKGITYFLTKETGELEAALAAMNPAVLAEQYSEATAQLKTWGEELAEYPAKAEIRIQESIAAMQKQLTESRQAGALDVIPEEYAAAVEAYKLALSYPKGSGTNYNELYQLMSAAESKSQAAFDATNLGIQVRTYDENIKSYLTEMNSLLDSFSSVTDFSDRMLVASSTNRNVDVYKELQYELTATALRARSIILRDKARQLDPPAPRQAVQAVALDTFEEFVLMAGLFERFGEYEKYDKSLRDEYIQEAYRKLERVKQLTATVQTMLLKPEGKKGGVSLDFLKPSTWGK